MKLTLEKRPFIHIAVIASDPLRFVGFRALLSSEQDFELTSASPAEIASSQNAKLNVGAAWEPL